jgi:hypothetical protein
MFLKKGPPQAEAYLKKYLDESNEPEPGVLAASWRRLFISDPKSNRRGAI